MLIKSNAVYQLRTIVNNSRVNNTQIDHAQYIDVVMPMYNLIEYRDNYSKKTGFYGKFVAMNRL